jgi:hypothetical protein
MVNAQANKAVVLLNDQPGDEKRVRAILADWGMETAAIRRVMKIHPWSRTNQLWGPTVTLQVGRDSPPRSH